MLHISTPFCGLLSAAAMRKDNSGVIDAEELQGAANPDIKILRGAGVIPTGFLQVATK